MEVKGVQKGELLYAILSLSSIVMNVSRNVHVRQF